MNREAAKETVKAQVKCTLFLTAADNRLYNCPFCGSGTKDNHTAALEYFADTNKFKCYSCGEYGDVIDLYKEVTGSDYNTALAQLADSLNIAIDPYNPAERREMPENDPQRDFNASAVIDPLKEAKTATEGTERDFSAYYKLCRARLTDQEAADYLQSRGISIDTAEYYYIGFDPAADPATAPGATGDELKPHPAPRIIIPTTRSHYAARRIDDNPRFRYLNAGAPGIFNARALNAQELQEVFVLEGAFDALSVLEAGYPAIALNSASNGKALIKQLENKRTGATLILCPDNDSDPDTRARVQKTFADLAAELKRLNISTIAADINGGYKDANEYLTHDRENFTATLEQIRRKTAPKPDSTAEYIRQQMQADIDRFTGEIKTGFKSLDNQTGGLYPGLYVLAAISSLGKTSFCLQLADQITAAGKDVIYFSLEQSRLELVSKSLARGTVNRSGKLNFDHAITSTEIRKGLKSAALSKAISGYQSATGDRMNIVEGNFSCNISFIGNYIRSYINRNGSRPVIFIDYLQLLQPTDTRQGIRETIDSSVTELKRLSRELDLTIIVISSVNRANYLTPIDFESLKESGGIEYTADVIYGLQLQCLNEDLFSAKEKIKDKRDRIKQAKAENPRKVEIVCLKNRYGATGFTAGFNYYPANDLFTEQESARLDKWSSAVTV